MVRKDSSTVLYKDGLMVRCGDGDPGKEFYFGDASSGDLGAVGACARKEMQVEKNSANQNGASNM